jgi:hypothetical protein
MFGPHYHDLAAVQYSDADIADLAVVSSQVDLDEHSTSEYCDDVGEIDTVHFDIAPALGLVPVDRR